MAEDEYGGAEQGRNPAYDNFGYQAELANRLHRDWPNGQKQIYATQENLYDSWSNMPREREEGTSISCKRFFIVLGVILLISGIIAGIVLAIYFSQRDAYVPEVTVAKTTMMTTTPIPVPKPAVKKFAVSLTTEGNFTAALNDSSSQEYKNKEQDIIKKMDAIYKNSSVADQYNGTEVLGFKAGSIIVSIRVIFIIEIAPASPTPAARNMTNPPPVGNGSTVEPTTRLDITDIINRDFVAQLIKANQDTLGLDKSTNISVIVLEIIATPAPTTTPLTTKQTTTPLATTTKTVLPTTSQRPVVTETEAPLLTTEKATETVTTRLVDKPTTDESKTSKPHENWSTSKPESTVEQFTTTLHSNTIETKTDFTTTLSDTTQYATAPDHTTGIKTNVTSTTPGTTQYATAQDHITEIKTNVTSTTSGTTQYATAPDRTTEIKTNVTSTTFGTTQYATAPDRTTEIKTNVTSTTFGTTQYATAQDRTTEIKANVTSATPGTTQYATAQDHITEIKTNVTSTTSDTTQYATTPNRTTEIKTNITTTPITYTVTTTSPITMTTPAANVSDDCNPEFSSCKNGQCIRRDWFCDEFIDCLDGSDEDNALCRRNITDPPKSTGSDLDCNFESQTKAQCNYKASHGSFKWQVGQGSTTSNKTGPDSDHTLMNSKGHFLFTESSYGSNNDKATFTSVIVTTDNTYRSLTFHYHMYGANMGSLEVYFNIIKDQNLDKDLKWKESGNHGNRWLKGCIELPKEVKLSVEFVAYRGLNYTSDITIDDIKYSTDSCISVSCTYEHSDCGHLMITQSAPDSYAWKRQRGNSVMGSWLAPKKDFTEGETYGHFLAIDSKYGNPQEKSAFRTPRIKTFKAMTFNFRLYMSGTGLGILKVNLLSEPNLASNLTYQTSSATQDWRRICLVVPKNFVGIVEFVAIRGYNVSGYIAVDDVAIGPESTCTGFSTCKFENGIFCKFDVTGNEYRWRPHNSMGEHYLIASGSGPEGSKSSLVSPDFIPLPNSTVNFRYAIEGTSILSVSITSNELDPSPKKMWTTEGLMTGVQKRPTDTVQFNLSKIVASNNRRDWLTACFQLPNTNNLSIIIDSYKVDPQGGKVILDWVTVSRKSCEIGLNYNACNFDEPNLCGYEIDCSVSTQYKWKRIYGATPTVATGPQKDNTATSTFGHYLYTEGSVGRQGDKAIVKFMNVKSSVNTSLLFHYYMSGRDIGSLSVDVGNAGNKRWLKKGDIAPNWYLACIDLPPNKKMNISFIGVHGNGPLSDIAIDDVHLFQGKCPEVEISCDFENEMMCGYTGRLTREMRDDKSFNEQWVWLNESVAQLPSIKPIKGHFLVTISPAKIMSPRIAYGGTMCLKFHYYIQLGKGTNMSVTVDYVDKRKNEVKLFGINGFSLAAWRVGQMTLKPGNLSVIFSVTPYDRIFSSTIFAFDDVNLTFGKCPEIVCSQGMFKCPQDDVCIPNYKKCDWVKDCSSGFDEQGCPANRSTIRLIDGITAGSKGRIEIYVNGSWATIYGLRWSQTNAEIACRQLGYTGFFKSMRYGTYFYGIGNVWQIDCIGNETSIQDCNRWNVVDYIPHEFDIGLTCYNTVCEPGKKLCPRENANSTIYCLHPDQFCDGDFDCPGGEDEKYCSNCKADEFTCLDHKCIAISQRCNGKPDCPDSSDEMNCVRRDAEGDVEIYYNYTWNPLCNDGYNEALYSSLCLIMGQGVVKQKKIGFSTSSGLIASPSSSSRTVIGKYDLSLSSRACQKLKLECYGQECGSRPKKMFQKYIQYGTQSIAAEYPWMGVLLRNGIFFCGCSIFSERWIITAAHCMLDPSEKYEVVVGLLRMQDLHKHPKYKVIAIIQSSNYSTYQGIPINDIALLLLEKKLVFNNLVQPVCLPSKLYAAKDYCYLSGWGRNENLVAQSHLKEAKVHAINRDECKKYYYNYTHSSFICFTHRQKNIPSCYGDSGGPLVCRNDRGRFELVGVVSFGPPLCAAKNGTPAAFSNILNFRGWIVDQTRCKMRCPDGKCVYDAEICDGIDHCQDSSDELPPKCITSVTCNFGTGYKCGYRNDSVNPWYWASPYWPTPHMKSKPMNGGDRDTDAYMLASVNATSFSPAKLLSPQVAEIPCISFKYMTNANDTERTVLVMKAKKRGSSSYNEVWNNGKNKTHHQMFWKLATVSLPKTTTRIMFEAYYENPNEHTFIALDSITVMDENCTVCHSTEFQCNNGDCINATYLCDRTPHCPDHSDELHCSTPRPAVGCNSDEFNCSNGQCILKDKQCNGRKDCRDGSDEQNCTGPCSWDQFHCNDGQCIEGFLKCDGFWHCKDGSDERYCHKTTVVPPGICKWNEFRCDNGQCIDFHYKCDNIVQCKDGSDEHFCEDKSTVRPGGCAWDQFRCNNGQCIQSSLRCDKMWQCTDGSDERNCPLSTEQPENQCRRDQFHCDDGYCIPRNLRCDGIWHCIDGSDEESCFSPPTAPTPGGCLLGQFRCNNGQCIESFLRCDRVKHCKDGSDEQYCGTVTIRPQETCHWDQFRCKNGECIRYSLKCDQIWHCRDGSDEQNCHNLPITKQGCKKNEFRCQDGQCIHIDLVCDRRSHCVEAEDERLCNYTTPTQRPVLTTRTPTTNITFITDIPPHVTQAIIFPARSTKIPHLTANPIPRGTRINISLVTAAPIPRGTRINISLDMTTPNSRGTKINTPVVTVVPIRHGTRINTPFVTATPIRRGTRINIPLVTVAPIRRGTRIDIPLVTEALIQQSTKSDAPHVTESPLRPNIPLASVTPVQHETQNSLSSFTSKMVPSKTEFPYLTVTSLNHGNVVTPQVTAPNKHSTRRRESPIKINHRTISTILPVTVSRTSRYGRTFLTASVTPIDQGRLKPSSVGHSTLRVTKSTFVTTPYHRTGFPHISTKAIQHGTNTDNSYVTAIPSPVHKTYHSNTLTTSSPHHRNASFLHVSMTPTESKTKITPHHVSNISAPHQEKNLILHVTTIPTESKTEIISHHVSTTPTLHHKNASIPHVTQTPTESRNTSISHHVSTTSALHLKKTPIVTTIPTESKTEIISHHVSTTPTLHHKNASIPHVTQTPTESRNTSISHHVSTVSALHHQENTSILNGTIISTDSKIEIIPHHASTISTPHEKTPSSYATTALVHHKQISFPHVSTTSAHHHKTPPVGATTTVDHHKKISVPHVSHSPHVIFPHLTSMEKIPTTPRILPFVTPRSNQYVTSSVSTLFSTTLPDCSSTHFRCSENICIPLNLRCNNVTDCPNGEDERNCLTTTTAKFPNTTSTKVPTPNTQTRQTIFTTQSTIATTAACAANEFRCDERQCIPEAFVCDVIPDCDNSRDEIDCDDSPTTVKPTESNACFPNEFKCDANQCIPKLFVCDAIPDCDNGRDELECEKRNTTHEKLLPGTCQSHEFRCNDGNCILKSKRCDTMADCFDKSDEENCNISTRIPTTTMTLTTSACAANEFLCDERQCIPEAFVCDAIPDCDNGRDEMDCDDSTTTVKPTESNACPITQFRCPGGKCIDLKVLCDNWPDCANGEDEKNCLATTATTLVTVLTSSTQATTTQLIPTTKACPITQFRCPEGKCIDLKVLCDNWSDCANGEDEKNCLAKTTQLILTPKGCADGQFRCDDGQCIAMSRYCDGFSDCQDKSDEKCPSVTPKTGCSSDDFRCDNGQCIPLSFRCDTLFDCNDGSDENNCNHNTQTPPSIQGCESDESHCKNGECVKSAFICDGLFDCSDSSDEEDCTMTIPTQATTTTDFQICTKTEYQCPSGKCINAEYVCDGVPDCPSAADETSCKEQTSSGPQSSIPPSDKCFPLEVKECLQVGYSRSLLPNVFGDKSYTKAMERFYVEAMPIVARRCSKNALMLFCGTIFPICKDGVSKYTCKNICREVEQSCGKDAILMDTCDWLVDDLRWCFIGLSGNEEIKRNSTRRNPLNRKDQACQKGYYKCKNSNLCLHPIHLCDGEPTCPQADDEPENCTCLPNQFRCTSGQCVMTSRRCNGYQDCKDYSDERNCSETECVGRLCKSGQCVPASSFCDGIFDCDDLSDEKLCECKPPHRKCSNQVCITADKWCNREDNCGDNSDEKDCDCSLGELMCSDGKCIPMEWWCDGNKDCSDGQDEAHCHKKNNSIGNLESTAAATTSTTTPSTTTTTTTTTTIVSPFKDNCRPDEFICTRGYKCIHRSKVCDMNWDCLDGEDEATCVFLRKEQSPRNSTAILTLTVQGQTDMVCSSKWSRDWAAFICKYLRHKNVGKVEFVDPPPGTTSFKEVHSMNLEYPDKDFIKTTKTCKTNKIVRMACNERICGTNRHHSIKYQEFIIGGDLARRYTWPWSVSLLYLGEPTCGATLISDRWLVTAAHCIVTGMWNRTKVPHYFSAILGEVDLFKGLMNGTRIPIDKIVLPGDMKLVVFNPDPDIALLRLKYPTKPNRQIEPICMPKLPKHDQSSTCYLAGWGGTHKPGEGRRRYSNFLHEVRMIIRNTSDCSTFRPQPNWEHNLCAGYLESTITGCYGDSGGALMCWEPDNRWTLVGILSKGRYNCAANSPNVFTKIGSMRQWIEESMGWSTEDL